MANGQEKARLNLESFIAWASSRSDDNFRQIVHRGILNRREIATACQFSKSALRQNPAIRKALEQLEDNLRSRGVLPALTNKAEQKKDEMPRYNNRATALTQDSKRLQQLEKENLELKAKLRRLEELSEVLIEMGINI